MGLNNGDGQLTYDGVSLPLSSPQMDEWVNRYVCYHEIFEFACRSWPGSRLIGMTFNNFLGRKPIRLGVLSWPVGASRWATFHALVTTADLAILRPRCYGTTNASILQARDLVIDDGTQAITASMYMLPPRLLSPNTGEDIYLLTLVDQRYFWWQRNGGVITINPGVTQWTDLYRQMETVLGIAVAEGPVNPASLTPYGLAAFDTSYEPLPILFDAIAYNVGQRVVALLNGNITCPTLPDSVFARNANLAQDWPVAAGGTFNFDQVFPPGPTGVDVAAILPSRLVVAFRSVVGKVLTGAWYPLTIQLSSLNPNIIGNGGTKTFHDTAQAGFQTSTQQTPDNFFILQLLAIQTASDYYNYLSSANQDVVYDGACPVALEGLHDVEWTYRGKVEDAQECQPERMPENLAKTRIMRTAWNYEPEELLHYQAEPPGSSSSSSGSSHIPFIDCPPGFVQKTVVTYVACDGDGLVVKYDVICTLPGSES